MTIHQILSGKKPEILKRWFDLIAGTYPSDTAVFLTTQKNRFHNPVGHTISEGIEDLFEELVRGIDPDRAAKSLDNIIRIRALQKFSPSQALSFIFLLKKVIRKEIADDVRKHQLFEELMTLESSIDELANISFDIYMKCREKLYELKANEVRNLTSRLLKRVNETGKPAEEEENTENGPLFNSFY